MASWFGGARALDRKAWPPRLIALAILAASLMQAVGARSAEVSVPLDMDYVTLDAALKSQLYTGPNGRATLWSGANDCQYLYAWNPRFSKNGAQVRLDTDARFSLGLSVAGRCVSPITWSGIVEAVAQPYVASDLTLKFRVTDLNLYNPQHQKTLLVSRGFDLIKSNFIPRFETFAFDLKPPIDVINDLVTDGAPPEVAKRVHQALAALRAEPYPVPRDDALRVTVMIPLPEMPTPAAVLPRAAPAPLTPAELAALQTQLDRWDAFLVFAVKQLGSTIKDKPMRDQLLALLLSSRYQLLKVLAEPQSAGPDPVRLLFLKTWGRLHDIVKTAAQRGLLGGRALEFLSFISAGDALMAFDQAAPALGMRISEADLRRLARIMAPANRTDPLKFNFTEDPELRKIFGVTEPVENPAALPGAAPPTPAAPSPVPTPSATPASTEGAAAPHAASRAKASPARPPAPRAKIAPPAISPTLNRTAAPPPPTPAPTAAAAPTASPKPMHTSVLLRILPWIGLDAAYAAEPPPTAARIRELGNRLRRVVVDRRNARRYKEQVGDLLDLTIEREIREDRIDGPDRHTFTLLVRTTAWQESCWRQFTRRRGRVIYLESRSGDIGLMQINKHVWRGFYSIPRLEWDVGYNAGAGAEILSQLMGMIADRGGGRSGGSDELARSAYAAYNGGPDDYERWRRREPRLLRLIDGSFWSKYRTLARGGSFNILKCSAEWVHAPGH